MNRKKIYSKAAFILGILEIMLGIVYLCLGKYVSPFSCIALGFALLAISGYVEGKQ